MVPKRIITDKLPSYGAARRKVMPRIEHRSHKRLKQQGISIRPMGVKRNQMVQCQGVSCPAGSCFSSDSAQRPFHHGVGRMKRNYLRSVLLHPEVRGACPISNSPHSSSRRGQPSALVRKLVVLLDLTARDRPGFLRPSEPPWSTGSPCRRTTCDA
jgi:hypothetical protein